VIPSPEASIFVLICSARCPTVWQRTVFHGELRRSGMITPDGAVIFRRNAL
jgi:hypothetical protein